MIICDEQQTQVSNEEYKNVHDVDILRGAQCSSNVSFQSSLLHVMELISINIFRNLYLSVSVCFYVWNGTATIVMHLQSAVINFFTSSVQHGFLQIQST